MHFSSEKPQFAVIWKSLERLIVIANGAKALIEDHSADSLFISCRGLSIDRGLTDSSEDEAELRRVMAKNSRKVSAPQ